MLGHIVAIVLLVGFTVLMGAAALAPRRPRRTVHVLTPQQAQQGHQDRLRRMREAGL
jgi:hypothetical protein